MKPFLFPQFPRFIAARSRFLPIVPWAERCVLWGGIVLLGVVHLRLATPAVGAIWTGTLAALATPSLPEGHIALAQIHWQLGNGARAREELLLANDLSPAVPRAIETSRVLGMTTTPLALLNQWEAEPNRLKSEYALWGKIAREKPDYRDAWVTLGTLAYQLGKPSEAKTYLAQALVLDPNYELTQKLLSLLP